MLRVRLYEWLEPRLNVRALSGSSEEDVGKGRLPLACRLCAVVLSRSSVTSCALLRSCSPVWRGIQSTISTV